jgi:hypothetical protein
MNDLFFSSFYGYLAFGHYWTDGASPDISAGRELSCGSLAMGIPIIIKDRGDPKYSTK